MKPMPPADLWAQMDRLNREAGVPEKDDEGFTPEEYGARYRMTVAGARTRLYAMAAKGLLIAGKRLVGSRWRTVFRPKEGT